MQISEMLNSTFLPPMAQTRNIGNTYLDQYNHHLLFISVIITALLSQSDSALESMCVGDMCFDLVFYFIPLLYKLQTVQ